MEHLLLLSGLAIFALILVSFVIGLLAKGINLFASPPINVVAFICA